MRILSFLLSISLATYVYIGIYILLVNPKDKIRRYFFLACMAFVVWSFGNLLITAGMTETIPYEVSRKIGYVGSILYAPLFMRFFLILTGIDAKFRNKTVLNLIIWALPAMLLYKNIIDNAMALDYPRGFWLVFLHVVNNTYNLLFIVIFVTWGLRSKFKREKMQMRLMFLGIVLTVGINYIFESLGYPTVTPVAILAWTVCLWYAMIRYRYFDITPVMVSHEILSQIDESVFLLDNDYCILYINPKAEKLLGKPKESLLNSPMSDIIVEHDIVKGMIEKNDQRFNEELSLRIHLKPESDATRLIDVRISQIKDAFNDFLGYLIIGFEIKELYYIKQLFGITDREAEVVQYVAAGYTNQQIAESLGVAERTVKTHVTNIFNKIGVNNRMELLHRLKRYDIDFFN